MTESDFIKRSPNITGFNHTNINLLISCSMDPEYPAAGDFQLPVAGTDLYIEGVTIPTTWNDAVFLTATLQDISTLRLSINGEYVSIPVIERQRRMTSGGTSIYYFLRTEKTFIGTTLPTDYYIVTGSTGVYTYEYTTPSAETIFIPFFPQAFGSNNYNPLINNFDNIVKSTSRQIIDNSSRFSSSSLPSNYLAIINQSAQPAEIPDSNYSKVGTVNGRYAGSITNDNGIIGNDPALGVKSFRGSIYDANSNNIAILVDPSPVIETIFYNVNTPPIAHYLTASYDFQTPTFPSPYGMLYLIDGVYQIGGNLLFKDNGNLLTRIPNAKVIAIDNSIIFTTDQQGHITNESNAN